jgi:REP element-mobilizing transposase RayT
MPRHGRIDAAGAVHHIIIRGIERKSIFYDDTDKNRFLERLGIVLLEGKAPCYAFVLLSNHVHLLLRTGTIPVASLMRRLLTGYAVSFNRRHKRSGHLFQNRYKSILCEEDPYFLQLVRYIHLNPLRAGIIKDFASLVAYPYSGHATIMGKHVRTWQDTEYVLVQFGQVTETARRTYEAFVEQGISEGRRSDLTGGGLLRSNKGWHPTKGGEHRKGDERILGSSAFVLGVLKEAEEAGKRSGAYALGGVNFETVVEHVARLFNVSPEEILLPGKYRNRVTARSVLCYMLVRKLGMTATSVAVKVNMGQPAVSMAVARGEAIVREKGLPVLDGAYLVPYN